jgi:hypothetical protein
MKHSGNFALLGALIAMAPAAQADIVKNLITGHSRVSYQIGDEWAVVSEQGNRPVSTVVYQIPNPADADTPESTNIVLILYDLSTAKGRGGYDAPLPHYSDEKPVESSLDGWSILKHTGAQNEVEYTILDARNDNVADLAASVRLAWPHMPGNAKDYDQRMEQTFREFLAGVRGEITPRTPDEKID